MLLEQHPLHLAFAHIVVDRVRIPDDADQHSGLIAITYSGAKRSAFLRDSDR
jgi:hypothetical protein